MIVSNLRGGDRFHFVATEALQNFPSRHEYLLTGETTASISSSAEARTATSSSMYHDDLSFTSTGFLEVS